MGTGSSSLIYWKNKAGAQRLSFNTAHLSSGVYYLVLRSATGKIIRNEKIIIQRT